MAKMKNKNSKTRYRNLRCRDGCVRYIDSGWTGSEWAAIEAAVARMQKPEPARRQQMSDTQQENEYATAWRPNAGDHIEGKVASIEMIDPSGQGAYPCVEILEDDGERAAIHAFHSVLRRELAKCAPKIGDRIAVTYVGKKMGASGREYHNYRVSGGHPREFDWDSQLPPEERASASAFGAAGSSGRATAEPPIAPAPVPAADEWAPLPKPPSAQEKAEQFGEAPPF